MTSPSMPLPKALSRPIRIKFCGLRNRDEVKCAIDLGVDAVGFVFAANSPRTLTLARAETLTQVSAPMLTRVALFRNSPASFVREVLASMPIEVLQFHGDEDPAFCAQFQRPYWKAIGMASGLAHAQTMMRSYLRASAFVCDAHAQGDAGGTGHSFNWSNWPQDESHALILAGGLTPKNVAEAIRATHCQAVDVSSGIESAPGVKDRVRMRQFVQAVRSIV